MSDDQNRSDVSVVFSFWNEEENLNELISRTTKTLEDANVVFELIFVNDVSTDRSLEILTEHHDRDPRIKVLSTSRNFGVNPCILAGMTHATGDAIIVLDSDLQDPPELMAEMISKWRAGADVVYTTRARREGESNVKLLVTKYAYRAINFISDIPLPVDAGMYRLMTRRVVHHVLSIQENEPYLRGLVTWVGFKQESIEYTRQPRFAGESHFPLFGKAPMAEFLRAIMAFSQVPIHVLLLCGIALTSVGALATIIAVALHFTHDAAIQYIFMSLIVFFAGSQWIAAGLLGLYIGRIWTQVKSRPRFIIESSVGIDSAGNPEGSSDV